ncbi:MAG: methyltransferase, partial [Acidobacteriota bacterium]|nr:methyltransferase [Acidobacteriota bacterium]
EWAIFLGSEWIWRPWGALYDVVRTGESRFAEIFGQGFCEYMAERPEEAAIYDGAMSAGSAMIVDSIVEAYDFSPFEKIVDVGGGQGRLLQGILEHNPRARGVLFDRPAVVAGAVDFESDALAGRCEILGGDFFEGVPDDGDVYLLKGIIHGFADDDAVRLLRACRRAMHPGGRLLIIETVPERSHEPNPQKAFMDLMMLALVPGKERSEDELRPLLAAAGLVIEEVIRIPGSNALVVCRVSNGRE